MLRMIAATMGFVFVWSTAPLVAAVPQTVAELWSDFDPRREPLEVETVREWRDGGGLYRYVRYRIGTFKGTPARMAAFYGYPEPATSADSPEKRPAVMHLHGGGQRASLEEVKAYVDRGYAALSVNWGGREMEEARPGDPNTDWGAVDPTQQNVPGYFNLMPGEKQLLDQPSPKNCNWYLLTIGCRRGLTFLESRPEVDPQRLGVIGHSMGGNLTMYVAGSDARVKAAAPSVGGQGFRTEPHALLGGISQINNVNGDKGLYAATLGFENYAPMIRCPVMHLSATNDFHGWMDDVYRTNRLIVGQPLRYAFSPHLNHRFIPEAAVTRPLWLDHFLRGGPPLPATPDSEWTLATDDGVPVLRVKPDLAGLPVTRVDIYYSVDPDPRARFWRDAQAVRRGDVWEASLPILDASQPLYAFANAFHALPKPESLPHMRNVKEVCLSSLLHAAMPEELKAAGVQATDRPSLVVDDFARGWHDWYRLNADHRPLWQNWTRKVADPKWRGPVGASLVVRFTLPADNRLSFVVVENEWRSYRGRKRTYVCDREFTGSAEPQSVALKTSDFRDSDGASPTSWKEVDLFGICARYDEPERGVRPKPANWQGDYPTFHRVEWQPSQP